MVHSLMVHSLMVHSLPSLLLTLLSVTNGTTPTIFLDPTLQEVVAPRHPAHQMAVDGFPRTEIDSTVDVLTYELWWDLRDVLTVPRAERGQRKAEARLRAEIRISSVATSPQTVLVLDAIGLQVDSVKVDQQPATFLVTENTLSIDLPTALVAEDTVIVDVYYAVTSDSRGLYGYSAAELDSAGLLEPIAFTFSQPQDSRRFFPCNDVPFDKAVITTHTLVPEGFTVVSNGVRTDSTADGAGSTWQTWHEPTAKPTYLLAFAVSRFHRYDQQAVLSDGRIVPILNYHWLADHEGPTYNAVRALQNIPAMFAPFEEAFGPYPLETYGHMTVAPIRFGGMEHQTMSTINRRWLVGDVESGYAHELAHQWVGDYVTCATWGDIWLNEGGASWGEAVWFGAKFGPEGYKGLLASRRNRYLRRGLAEPPVYDIPLAILFNEATTYSKSAWIYHMMRTLVGDELFFPALQAYLRDYAFGAAQTADLLAVMEREIPSPVVPWATFFEQWLHQAGHPVLATVVRVDAIVDDINDGRYPCRVTIRQTQSGENVPNAFVTPLTIRLQGGGQQADTTVLLSERVGTYTVHVPFIPDSVTLDPDDDILCEKTSAVVTSVGTDRPASVVTSGIPHVRSTLLTVAVQPQSVITIHAMDGTMLYQRTETSDLAVIDTGMFPVGVVAVSVRNHGALTTVLLPITD